MLAPPTAARLARGDRALAEPWPTEAQLLAAPRLRSRTAGRGETLEETGAHAGSLLEGSGSGCSRTPRPSTGSPSTGTSWRPAWGVADPPRGAARRAHGRRAPPRHRQGQPDRAQRGGGADRAQDRRAAASHPTPSTWSPAWCWHLLLAETATTRDPDDPATVDLVVSRLETVETLDLLLALTEADARATAPKAWSSLAVRADRDLARRARAALGSGAPLPPVVTDDVALPAARSARARCRSRSRSAVTALGHRHRPGPGGPAGRPRRFALARLPVRAARAWSRSTTASRCGESPRRRWTPASCDSATTRSSGPRRCRPAAADRGPSALRAGRRTPRASDQGDRAGGADRRPPGRGLPGVCRAAALVAVRSARTSARIASPGRRRLLPQGVGRCAGRRTRGRAAHAVGPRAVGAGPASRRSRPRGGHLRSRIGLPDAPVRLLRDSFVRHSPTGSPTPSRTPAAGSALRGRHRRHRARDPHRAARGRRRPAVVKEFVAAVMSALAARRSARR